MRPVWWRSARPTGPDRARSLQLRLLPRTALAFFAGAMCGALWLDLGSPGAPPSVDPRGADGVLQATPVRGLDVATARAALGASAEAVAAGGPSTPRLEAAPEAKPATASSPGGRASPMVWKPADIAQAALGHAVYVGGGDVYAAGIVLDDAGHVLTCDHVVEGLTEIEVRLAGGVSMAANVVARDGKLDLALLDVGAALGGHPARLASVQSVRMGDDLYSMGSPRKMRFTLGRGMATYVGRDFEGVRYLQTDLPLNGGSSGGPVMNARGEVVAISSFVLKDSEGLAFALPIDYAVRRFARWLGPPADPSAAGGPTFEAWLASLDDAH